MDKELYNIENDPGQENDVSQKHPDVVKAMREHYQKWKKITLPDYNKKRYIHLGNENQNPLMLYSSDWQGSYADNKGNLFAGDRIGYWEVIVDTPGNYEFTLSRWHPAAGIPLNGTMKDRNGNDRGAIPVAQARLRIGDYDQALYTEPNQSAVKFSVPLKQGVHRIETWFLDQDGNVLCSAYYTNTELIK